MIIVTRLNDTRFYLNPHLIECMEETPDTVITLTTGKKLVVRDKVDEIIKKIIEYRRSTAAIDLNSVKREYNME